MEQLLKNLLAKIAHFERGNTVRAARFVAPERIESEDEAAFDVRLRLAQATHLAQATASYEDLQEEMMHAYDESKEKAGFNELSLAFLIAGQSLLYAYVAIMSFKSMEAAVKLAERLPYSPASMGPVLSELSGTVVEHRARAIEKVEQAKQAILATGVVPPPAEA